DRSAVDAARWGLVHDRGQCAGHPGRRSVCPQDGNACGCRRSARGAASGGAGRAALGGNAWGGWGTPSVPGLALAAAGPGHPGNRPAGPGQRLGHGRGACGSSPDPGRGRRAAGRSCGGAGVQGAAGPLVGGRCLSRAPADPGPGNPGLVRGQRSGASGSIHSGRRPGPGFQPGDGGRASGGLVEPAQFRRTGCRRLPGLLRGHGTGRADAGIHGTVERAGGIPAAADARRGPVSAGCLRQRTQCALERGASSLMDPVAVASQCLRVLVLALILGAPLPRAWAQGPQAAFPPDHAAVRAAWRPSDVRLLASDGRELQRLRTDFSSRRGAWLPLAVVSAALLRAVVASEDRRFYTHGGVDWLASASAAWSSAGGIGARRGASTLSLQLAAFLDPTLRRGPAGRGILQKLDQMQAAMALESRWTKSEILEAYLNLAAWRGELVGVDALSRVLFQKHASGLNLREAALAAVLLRGPNAPVPLLVQRSCALMRELGRPDACHGLRGFVQAARSRAGEARFDAPALAPHWTRLLRDVGLADARGEIHSTLDRGLQEAAVRSVRRRLGELRGTGVTDAAVVVLDNRSGAVLAYVGSSGVLSEAAQVDHARAVRQAGSTLKPFLYAMALDQQRLT